jgi:hypothetical protein
LWWCVCQDEDFDKGRASDAVALVEVYHGTNEAEKDEKIY